MGDQESHPFDEGMAELQELPSDANSLARNTRLTSELATTVTSMASRAQSRSPLATTPTRKLPEASSMFQANGRERIMQDFLRAAESQDIPVTDDLQDLVTG
jgi:hypothetical protein